MTTTYRTRLGTRGPRYHAGGANKTTIIIGGQEYTEAEIDASPTALRTNSKSKVDWDSLNEVTVNTTDTKQCR